MERLLSYNECKALKGFAILLIVLHNLIHCVTPFHENEKFFDSNNASYYIEHFSEAPFLSFIGYFGWAGVVFFIFLTGYGLSIKYNGTLPDVEEHYGFFKRRPLFERIISFVVKHYKKLFVLALLPYAFHIDGTSVRDVIRAFPDLLFIRNLLFYPDSSFGTSMGAYWYLGLCMELYVFYALSHKYFDNKIFVAVTLIISLCVITIPDASWIKYAKYNFIGWLPLFYLGYFAAKVNIEKVPASIRLGTLFVSLPLYIYSGLNQYLWFVSDIFAIISVVAIAPCICNRLFVYIGGLSSFVFVCHPIVRDLWLKIDRNYLDHSCLYIYGLLALYLLVCIALSEVYKKFVSKIRF